MNYCRIYLVSMMMLICLDHAKAQSVTFNWPESYSVKINQTGYGDPSEQHFYVSGKKSRSDMSVNGGPATTTIVDLEAGEMISILPNKIVNKTKSPAGVINISHPFPNGATWQEAGSEEINGQSAKKYIVKDSPTSSGFFVWLSTDGKTPIRMSNNKMSYQRNFSDFHAGSQDQALFKVP